MSITAVKDIIFVDLLRYDKETGKLYWSVSTNGRIKVGDFALTNKEILNG